jgi:serine protease Do
MESNMVDAAAQLSIRTANRRGRRGALRIVVPAGLAAFATVLFSSQHVAPGWGFASAANAQTAGRPGSFADVVERVKPAVISVRVKFVTGKQARDGAPGSGDKPSDRSSRRFGLPDGGADDPPNPRDRNLLTGQGSGFFISADGYAVTNFHVVDKTNFVEVTTDDGRVLAAKVIGADERSDVALIKVEGGDDLPFVRFADVSPRIGDWVIAVGNPFGLGGSVTAGIVSARGRDIGAGPYDDFIQIDAAVNRGNSGGPTFDVDGNVIGVNTAIVSPTGGSVGIAFAIPAETVKAVVAQLKDKGKVTRGWIGVQIQDITRDIAQELGLPGARGTLVAEPEANGPAAKAGIEAGDVITAIDGKGVGDSREAARTISNLPPGSAVKLSVTRKGEQKTITVTLGSLPEQREVSVNLNVSKLKGTSVPKLGASVASQSGGTGVVVTDVDPDGIAADRGLRTGDVILQAAGRKVGSSGDLRSALEAALKAGNHTVLLRVKSRDGLKYITVPVGRG